MSKPESIKVGEVEIELDGETRVMKPTLRAAQRISNEFGGYAEAVRKLASFDLTALTFVIRQGLNPTEREAKELPEQVWRAGLQKLVSPAIDYVNLLSNGGRRTEDEAREGEAEGNDQAA